MIVIAVVLIVVAAIVAAGAVIGGGGSASIEVLNLVVTTTSTGFFFIGAGAGFIFLIGVALLSGGLRRGSRRRREVRDLRERAERAERRNAAIPAESTGGAAGPPATEPVPTSDPYAERGGHEAVGSTGETYRTGGSTATDPESTSGGRAS